MGLVKEKEQNPSQALTPTTSSPSKAKISVLLQLLRREWPTLSKADPDERYHTSEAENSQHSTTTGAHWCSSELSGRENKCLPMGSWDWLSSAANLTDKGLSTQLETSEVMAGQQQRLGDGETWSLSFQGRQRNFVSPGFCSPGVLLDPKQSKLLSSVFPISNCFTLWLAALHPQESCIHPTTPWDSSRLKSWET